MLTSTIETHSTAPTCTTATHFVEATPELRRLAAYAREVGVELGLPSLPDDRLAVIVGAALEVRDLLFVAALHDPAPIELQDFVEDFLLRALTSGTDFQ
jgi:hypothetical protein